MNNQHLGHGVGSTDTPRAANIQVYRKEIHTSANNAPEIIYYLGWGDTDEFESAPISFEELQALNILIERVIKTHNNNK